IFIYDGYPGGIGLAASVHGRIEDLCRATRELLEQCPCEGGCPSCVQSPKSGSGNWPLDKDAARMVLSHLSGVKLDEAPLAERSRAAASFAGSAGAAAEKADMPARAGA